jgi:hypothetical protein
MSEAIPSRTEPDDQDSGAEVSEGPSGFGTAETAVGGADSVPDTPDAVPADDLYTD